MTGARGATGTRGVTGPTGPAGTAGTVAGSVAANESTTSLAYTDLTTVGPTVNVTVPASGRLLVSVTSAMLGNSGSTACFMSFAGTGTTVFAAVDADALIQAGGAQQRASAETVLSGLTPGAEVLTAKYKVTGGGAASCAYSNRSMFTIPLP